MDLKKAVNSIYNELVDIRRDFHMHPELSTKEFRTRDKICEYLTKWGIEHEVIATTGVVGIIRGKESGNTVALRADIDALPIKEENNVLYKSKYEGIMHACGHDAHATILLGVAKLLKQMEDSIKGNVKLFFQPAEESTGGALPMINEGCMDNPKVDYVLGLHVMPNLDAGKVELKYGKLNASTDSVNITIKGKSGHGAYPEQGIDAIMIAGHVLVGLQSIVSRNISPLNSVALSIGTIQGGTRGNVISDEVTMIGTLRTLDSETRQYTKDRIKGIVENISASFGGSGEAQILDGYEPLVNDSDVVNIIKNTSESLLGRENIVFKETPSLGGEDFSYFSNRTKGGFFHLGCGNSKKHINNSLHNSSFDIDEECLKVGVRLQIANTLALLDL
ncbi:M20 family metallopeptidase [Clostridiaceae bacterium M8S5]|nr:M20 family metallopeptidase [Clostridiaceae bacterium M8S5]